MPKIGKKKLIEWDECQMVEDDVKDRLENWHEFYDEKPDEEELRRNRIVDHEFFEEAWDDMVSYLTEKMKYKNKGVYWKATVKDFGWMNQDGYQYLQAENGKELLDKILPKCDCTFKIYNYGKGLAILNFHHDSPMGEWYYILPCAESTYEKNN